MTRLRCIAGALVLVAHSLDAQSDRRMFPLRVESSAGPLRIEALTPQIQIGWGIAFLDARQALVTERVGALWRVVLDAAPGAPAELTAITGLPAVAVKDQGGLLDVAVHPDFAGNQVLYLCYSAKVRKGRTTRLARYVLDGNRLTDARVLFTAEPALAATHHFGCRIALDDRGHLYFSVGDRGERHMAQMLYQDVGKVHRLNDDGSVPADNPFVGKGRARESVWSSGHRNPQGLAFDPATGVLWAHEHGPRGGDEINRIEPGQNYGWPVVSYGREYHGPAIGEGTDKAGMAPPALHWTPSIAPSGLAFHAGEFFPEWRGSAFVGALALAHLNRVRIDGDRVVEVERLFEGLGWRVRDVEFGPDGLLYLLVDGLGLLRVVPA